MTCFCIIDDRTTRHINNAIIAISSVTTAFATITAVSSENVTFVAQVQECPIVTVATQIDMTTPSAISSVRASIGGIFGTMHVGRTTSAFA